ncbi:hypothetical protein BC828DRAFT_374853 [Blastocladiella britannica]|nr:hypothetical protein BC828DRAFT_374853 [Blastocladiella britannica]
MLAPLRTVAATLRVPATKTKAPVQLALSWPWPTTSASLEMRVDPTSATALDIVNRLRAETGGMAKEDVRVTRGYSPHRVSDADLDAMPAAQLMRSNLVVWVPGTGQNDTGSGGAYTLDAASSLSPVLRAARAAAADADRASTLASASVSRVQAAADRSLARVLYGGTAALTAQLGAVVHLTYELGWDLMEPATNMLGLTTVILSGAFFAAANAEFTYANAANVVRDRLRRWHARRMRVDLEEAARTVEHGRRVRAQLTDVLAVFAPPPSSVSALSSSSSSLYSRH